MADERACSLGTPGCFCDARIGEAWACAWCGTMHWVEAGGLCPMTGWCGEECMNKHRAANPECAHFKGYMPISDTLPGGPHDGVWENSGLRLGGSR